MNDSDHLRQGPDPGPSNLTRSCERYRAFITHIYATDVASGIRRTPATTFYVLVEIEGTTTSRSSSNPASASAKGTVEWGEEILLPSERAPSISFKVYASLKYGAAVHRKGILLRRFRTTVGDILDSNATLQPIRFLDGKSLQSESCLRVGIEHRVCNFATKPWLLEADITSQLTWRMDAGRHALLRYREVQKQKDLNEAVSLFERALDMCPPDHPNRFNISFTLATAKFIRCRDNNNFIDLGVPIALYQEALQLPISNHADHCVTALDLCFGLLSHLRRLGDESETTKAKDLLYGVVKSYAYQAAWLALQAAGISVPMRFMVSGDSRMHHLDTEELIKRARSMLSRFSDREPLRPQLLSTLGTLLYDRFKSSGNIDDINEAILSLEDALQLTPDGHPRKQGLLNYLGTALSYRFESLGELVDIDKSITMFEEALHLPNEPFDKPALLNNLASSLSRRYEHVGDLTDIDRSISYIQTSIRLTPDGHPNKPGWLMNLGVSLSSRFRRLGDLADVNQIISLQEEAVRLIPDCYPDRPSWLSNLGISLLRRFEYLDDTVDLEKSILLLEEAVQLTPDTHADKLTWLHHLGSLLSSRFKRFGDLADLEKSISLLKKAVKLAPLGYTDKPTLLGHLGKSLSGLFEHLGNILDINMSISTLEEALHLLPNSHPHKPGWMNDLGHSLLRRFEHLGDLADLTKSISLKMEAVHLTPCDHPDKLVRLNSLAISLYSRFERIGDITDMDTSISLQEEAVASTPKGHPDKAVWLYNLANSLSCRFAHLGDPADINRSITMSEQSVCLTPNDDPNKHARLNGLGASLFRRFERLGHPVDISKSISMFKDALDLIPDGHPDKSGCLSNLGNALMQLYLKHSRDPSSLSAASLHFAGATRATTGSAHSRFYAARRWIMCENNSQVLDAYSAAIDLLPKLAWFGLPLAERHRALSGAADLARDAAAAAIEAGCSEMAVGWLEQGRSVVWNQFLELRTPVDELRAKHPALASQFQKISQELEHASSRGEFSFGSLPDGFSAGNRSHEKEVQRHHDLALSREKLLTEIRSLPGFERFFLPKPIKHLAAMFQRGPVVYLNASEHRCDALIVMPESGDIVPAPLPGTSYLRVEKLQSLLHLLLKHNRLIISRDEIAARIISDDSSMESQQLLDLLLDEDANRITIGRAAKVKPQQLAGYLPDDLLRRILAYLWNEVVSPVLDVLGFSTTRRSDSAKLARIFWCPTGPFSFLPIHAAGIYGAAEGGAKLSDVAISSYIPTLGAIASESLKDLSDNPSRIRLLVVPQPQTDGLDGLPSVTEEVDHIRRSSALSPSVTFQDSCGTVEDVMEQMGNADWVHFACHGIQDPDDPLDSGLCLADARRLKLSNILRLSHRRGGLAFLSACQTAQGDDKLTEESVHLAAGMLLAGYGGVIATMWAIRDADAPKVTRDVYEHLFRDRRRGTGVPDCTEAAEALHYAVQRLRASGAPFLSWIPFIHVGR